jgi:Holliday junction DNA helicase RuvA
MYEYIKGTYAGMNKDYIVIENNGIGYKVYTSGSTLAEIPKTGMEVMLYLEQIVRQDFIGLYGFLTKEELNMFKLLLTINGVGARAALSLLSISNVNNLKYAILSSDEKTIIRAPGIGKKMAQRIILELKDKIRPDEFMKAEGIDSEGKESMENVTEAMEALIALGYSDKEAQGALKSADKKASIENIIKDALKFLMS